MAITSNYEIDIEKIELSTYTSEIVLYDVVLTEPILIELCQILTGTKYIRVKYVIKDKLIYELSFNSSRGACLCTYDPLSQLYEFKKNMIKGVKMQDLLNMLYRKVLVKELERKLSNDEDS